MYIIQSQTSHDNLNLDNSKSFTTRIFLGFTGIRTFYMDFCYQPRKTKTVPTMRNNLVTILMDKPVVHSSKFIFDELSVGNRF